MKTINLVFVFNMLLALVPQAHLCSQTRGAPARWWLSKEGANRISEAVDVITGDYEHRTSGRGTVVIA